MACRLREPTLSRPRLLWVLLLGERAFHILRHCQEFLHQQKIGRRNFRKLVLREVHFVDDRRIVPAAFETLRNPAPRLLRTAFVFEPLAQLAAEADNLLGHLVRQRHLVGVPARHRRLCVIRPTHKTFHHPMNTSPTWSWRIKISSTCPSV